MEDHHLAKWLEGTMTESERKAFEQSPEYAAYEKIRIYSDALKAPDFDSEQMYRNITQRPKESKESKVVPMKTNWFLRIAAVLVIALGLFFTYQSMPVTQNAQNGRTTVFNLPDASLVTLNSGSEISYKKWNWEKQRTLELDGEAFFKVTKGKTFDVNTNLGRVTVVGTQFNVKARGKRFEVQCYEGKVLVQYNHEMVFLTKGMTISVENGHAIGAVVLLNPKPLWVLENRVAFNSESLESVNAEIQRKYDVVIDCQNCSATQRFTGAIPCDNLDMALQIIAETYHLKYTKAKNRITFTPK